MWKSTNELKTVEFVKLKNENLKNVLNFKNFHCHSHAYCYYKYIVITDVNFNIIILTIFVLLWILLTKTLILRILLIY